MNASWNTEYIRQYHSIDISVAVQTPGGLMVPIVHDADALGLSDISAKVKDLATKVSRQSMTCSHLHASSMLMQGRQLSAS